MLSLWALGTWLKQNNNQSDEPWRTSCTQGSVLREDEANERVDPSKDKVGRSATKAMLHVGLRLRANDTRSGSDPPKLRAELVKGHDKPHSHGSTAGSCPRREVLPALGPVEFAGGRGAKGGEGSSGCARRRGRKGVVMVTNGLYSPKEA